MEDQGGRAWFPPPLLLPIEERSSPRAQVVGWPPIRSYRKNIMSQKTTTTTEVAEKTSGSGEAAFVKVCMDRAPYLRKVGLENTRATNSPLMPWPRFSVPSPWGLLVLRVDAAVSAEVAFLPLLKFGYCSNWFGCWLVDCLSVCYEEKADQVRRSYQDSGVKLRSYFLGIIKFKAHRMCCGGLAGPWLSIWCMLHVCVAAVFF
ncbi:hypothetical protein C3L33_15023, partial [Rhododendron williamsianum]